MENLRELFDRFDTDGGGTISAFELDAALIQMGMNLSMDDIEAMMKEVDKDSSGEISFQEFANLMMRDKKNEDKLSSERKHRPAVQGGNHRIEGLHGNFSSIADIANAFDKYQINDTRAYRKGGDRRMQNQESLRKRKEIRKPVTATGMGTIILPYPSHVYIHRDYNV